MVKIKTVTEITPNMEIARLDRVMTELESNRATVTAVRMTDTTHKRRLSLATIIVQETKGDWSGCRRETS